MEKLAAAFGLMAKCEGLRGGNTSNGTILRGAGGCETRRNAVDFAHCEDFLHRVTVDAMKSMIGQNGGAKSGWVVRR